MKLEPHDSKLTKIELEIAFLERKRCLHILEEYLLPQLLNEGPQKIIESLIEIRDIFFLKNEKFLFDFDNILSVEKNDAFFDIAVDGSNKLRLLFGFILVISVQGKKAVFALDRDESQSSYNLIMVFAKALEEILTECVHLEEAIKLQLKKSYQRHDGD